VVKNSICYPAPPIQKEIAARIEEEQKLVEANKKLIEIFEGKIKAKIAEVWEYQEDIKSNSKREVSKY